MNNRECIVQCERPEAVSESQRYDVFVSSRGCRFEFGPRRMKVVGKYTREDGVEFAFHVRHRTEARKNAPPAKTPQVRVLGIRLG
jgi:hypothetical protein